MATIGTFTRTNGNSSFTGAVKTLSIGDRPAVRRPRQEYARSGLALPNTLELRNGYSFVVQITKNTVLRP